MSNYPFYELIMPLIVPRNGEFCSMYFVVFRVGVDSQIYPRWLSKRVFSSTPKMICSYHRTPKGVRFMVVTNFAQRAATYNQSHPC